MRMQAILVLTAIGLTAACEPLPSKSDGKALYSEFCISCHGETGRGDGPAAAGLDRKPADLTTLARRNGGAFPMMDVLSAIDGYTRAEEGNLTMPEFGVMMEDQPSVLVDTGDGIPTPTPKPLLALAEYLQTLQR